MTVKFQDIAKGGKLFGDKKSVNEILDVTICILAFAISESKYKDRSSQSCVKVQFYYVNDVNQERFVFFTGSNVVKEQLINHKEFLPFSTVVKKINKYFTLT